MRIYKTRSDFTSLQEKGNIGIFSGTVCTITDEIDTPMYAYKGVAWELVPTIPEGSSNVTAISNPNTGRIVSSTSGGKNLGYIARSQPLGQAGRFSLSGSNERGSSGTYHTTFRAAGDFYAVAPIINVTRTPTDGTYTNDDIYDQVAVAPSATILTGGYPDASGGASAWTASASMTFARNASASTATPIPVIGTQIFCNSIARSDAGPGRILMARAYSTGSGHAQAATTRMPTYYPEQLDLATCQKWDDPNIGFPLSGHAQYYYLSLIHI